ncbi:phosphoribosyl-ATP diphosphatase [Candidatus Foliamicus sp.]
MSKASKAEALEVLLELETVIRARGAAEPEESYTARLLGGGMQRVAQKFGEESVELALAAAAGDRENVRAEAADVIYHLLVLLEGSGVSLAEALDELRARRR